MKLPNLQYNSQFKRLAMDDASQSVNLAQGQANLIGKQGQAANAWAGVANAESNSARAWGRVYEQAGRLPHEMAQIAEKYDAARADASVTSKMTDFSKKYSEPMKKEYTPEELTADGIEFDAFENDLAGNKVPRTSIPKHEIYAKAFEKYSADATATAKKEFGFISYSDQWGLKNQQAMESGNAEAVKKQGAMAFKYLSDDMSTQTDNYVSQGKFGAAFQTLQACESLHSQKQCNGMRMKVTQSKQISNVNDAMISGSVKKMTAERMKLEDGLYNLDSNKTLGLMTKLDREIKRTTSVNEATYLSNTANNFLEAREGQDWSAQEQEAQNIPDAKLRKETLTQLKARRSSDETNKRIEQQALFDKSYQSIEEGGQTVPPEVTDGRDRATLQSIINAKAKGVEVKTDTAVWGGLHTMSTSPETMEEFASLDLNKYAGKISRADLKSLMKQQTDIKAQTYDAGLASISKRVQDSILTSMGKKSIASLGDGDNRATYFQINKQIEDRLVQMRKEGTVTRDMENKVIAESLATHSQEGYFFDSEYETGDFSEEDLIVSGNVFKTYKIAPTNQLRLYIKEYPDIPQRIIDSGRSVTSDSIKIAYDYENSK